MAQRPPRRRTVALRCCRAICTPRSTTAAQATAGWIRGPAATAGGRIQLEFSDQGGNPYWMVNGIEVRPGEILNMGIAPKFAVADGTTETTHTGVLASSHAMVTVATTLGTIITPDADPHIAGIQVGADEDGNFPLAIRHPSGAGLAVLSFSEQGFPLDVGPHGAPVIAIRPTFDTAAQEKGRIPGFRHFHAGQNPRSFRHLQRMHQLGTHQNDQLGLLATHFPLADEAVQYRLISRLNVMEFHLPPLRDRPKDIVPMALAFVEESSPVHDVQIRRVHPDFLACLKHYDWPGNIGELKNYLRRAVLFCRKGELSPKDLAPHLLGVLRRRDAAHHQEQEAPKLDSGSSLTARIAASEKAILEEALRNHSNDRTATAKALGLGRVGLYRKMRKYGMIDRRA